uniref:DNA topoisomerase (ATP-hydrolyzing) n=1 Tax=Panagrellus redivivus TaxID=6233 RepID=A0A7E4ZZ65_PANRE
MSKPFLTTDFFKDEDDSDDDALTNALSQPQSALGDDFFASLASPARQSRSPTAEIASPDPQPCSSTDRFVSSSQQPSTFAGFGNNRPQVGFSSQRAVPSQPSQRFGTQKSTNAFTQPTVEEILERFDDAHPCFGFDNELPPYIDPAPTQLENLVLQQHLPERSQIILSRIRDAILNLSVEATETRNPKMLYLKYNLYSKKKSRIPAKKEQRMGSRLNAMRPLASKVRLLELIQKMILTRSHATKRDLFYKHKSLFGTQNYVDRLVTDICNFLDATRDELFILSCSRGSVMGPLTLCTSTGIINCEPTPTSIANNFSYAAMRTTADYVLIVEKDTIFQRLIDENFFDHFPRVVLVTGRGFPDFATRQFLKRVHDDLRLPMYTFMDCDPHGLHIAMTYKYGSASKKVQIEGGDDAVTLKNLQHIGLLPSQMNDLLGPLQRLPFNRTDFNKIHMVIDRSKEVGDTSMLYEAETLAQCREKVELEALHAHSPHFIIDYLLQRQNEFPMILNFDVIEKSTPALAKMYEVEVNL